LGCQVHWEEKNDRFFCPCHNGAFDRTGVATEGPPALAKQTLKEFKLQVVNGLLFIEAPMTKVDTGLAQADAKSKHTHLPTREA
jgi:Rieske Fe-S protein